jgi:branched-chain amino acid aminotransferase
MAEIVYVNGSLVPAEEARISAFDHGFLYGYGLFETMRAYNGKIFLLDRHINRLSSSAAFVGLGAAVGKIDVAKACMETLEANNLNDARIRFTVTGGEADAYPWATKGGMPTVVITARPYTAIPAEKYKQGYKICLASVRRNKQSILSHVKSTSYIGSTLAKIEAAGQGADEALLLNEDGYLTEGGSSNIFFIRSSRLVTPSIQSGILPGITREVVMELAGELEISVTEGTVGVAIIRQCDEAFLTGSVMEIMPMTEAIDKTGRAVIIGSGKPGPITLKLMAAYRNRVQKETGNE